ncbi:MAG: hypothetical protein SGILL_009110, partial [Bacillariaceae sp.]
MMNQFEGDESVNEVASPPAQSSVPPQEGLRRASNSTKKKKAKKKKRKSSLANDPRKEASPSKASEVQGQKNEDAKNLEAKIDVVSPTTSTMPPRSSLSTSQSKKKKRCSEKKMKDIGNSKEETSKANIEHIDGKKKKSTSTKKKKPPVVAAVVLENESTPRGVSAISGGTDDDYESLPVATAEYIDLEANVPEPPLKVSVFKESQDMPTGIVFGLQEDTLHVIVARLKEDSMFHGKGIQSGMQVMSINGTPCPTTTEGAADLVKESQGLTTVELKMPKKTKAKKKAKSR